MTKTGNPLKWHGGKAYLASKIVELMPPRCKNPNKPDDGDPGYLHYVEPYAGGLSVLLANDPDGISEVANDINGPLTIFWKTLQNQAMFSKLQRLLEATPFSDVEFEKAGYMLDGGYGQQGNVELAWAFFVMCRQSLAGRMKGFTGITKTRTRRGMNNEVSAWLSAIEGLPQVHERLKRVLIVNRPALDVIQWQDGPRTLFYLDPPYLHETRATTTEYGDDEMSNDDHVDLMELLPKIEGKFILSGYHSKLYDSTANLYRWNCVEWKIDNKASSGKTKRIMTECVWTNF